MSGSSYIQGYDLSDAQSLPTIQDWEAMVKAGIKFVLVECGIGNDGISSAYHSYMASAKAVGLIAVPYHFIYALPPSSTHANRSPEDQAALHYSYCGSNACIDVEYPTSDKWAEFGIPSGAAGSAFVNDWVMRYLAKYKELCGGTPWVYTYPSYAQQIGFSSAIAEYPLWVASYESSPASIAPWGTNWACWQYSGGGGKLPSNGEPVDQDCVVSLSVFDSLLSSAPSVPVSKPTPAPTPVIPTPSPWVAPSPTPDPLTIATNPIVSPSFWQSFGSFFGWIFGRK